MDTFFSVLFEIQESTCFTDTQKGTKVSSLQELSTSSILFCINALHPTKDLKPTEPYHNENRPRRADCNVVSYRNILIEMDSIPVEEQKELIASVKIPYTTAVFSGGKSIHYIISLETPVSDEKAYRKLVERVYRALGGKRVVDLANKNPSRLSRFPGAYRADKERTQDLLEVKARVNNEELEQWLISRGVEDKPEVVKRTHSPIYKPNSGLKGVMNGFTLNFIMCGAPEGERNLSLFKASCDLYNCGYDEDEIIDRLEGPSGLDNEEVTRTVRSAIRKVKNDNYYLKRY